MIKYLIVVRFGPEEPPGARARKSVPAFQEVIARHCTKENTQLAFTSRDASVFGYLIKTDTPIAVIHKELFGETSRPGTSALLTNDDLFAVECGPDFTGRGFSQAWTWLQHR